MGARCTAASKALITSIALTVLAVAFTLTASATDPGQGSGTSAYVYVGQSSNNGDGNIYGFAVAPNGSAQPVPGSPVTGADESLVSADSFVFATDGKNIVTYTAASSGRISQTSSVDGIAYDQDQQSAFVGSLSVPLDGRNLYTDNGYVDGANNAYEQWRVNSSGQLSYLPRLNGLPLYSTAGGWPLTFTPSGNLAYVWSICKWDGSVWGFKRLSNGSLQKFTSGAQGLNGSGQGSSVCSQGVATSALGFVAVAWNGSYCCGGPQGIVTYSIQSNGTLAKRWQGDTVENAMAFDPSGDYLAVAVASGIQVYRLQNNGALVPIGGIVESEVPFAGLAWDSVSHLYAIPSQQWPQCQNNNSACGLYIFNSNSGVLSLASGSPHTILQPGSLAVLGQ